MKVLIMRALAERDVLLGKTFVWQGESIFFHESPKEEVFVDLDSPYGVDEDVANWLELMQIQKIHHYVQETDRLYIANVSDLMTLGIPHALPEITRIYLPAPLWDVQTERPYKRPWIEDSVVFAAWNNGGGPTEPPIPRSATNSVHRTPRTPLKSAA